MLTMYTNNMDHIGLVNLTNIFVENARDDKRNTINLLLSSLELCEDSHIYEKLAIEYEQVMYFETNDRYGVDYDNHAYLMVIYCYEKALELNTENTKLYYNFANFWKHIDDKVQMLKYLKLGADKNDLSCILLLVKYYYNDNKKMEWLKYCLQSECYNKNYDEFIYKLYCSKLYDILNNYIYKKIYEIYDLLHGNMAPMLLKSCVEESKKYAEYHKNQLRNNPLICTLNNKVRLFTKLKNVHECVICYEEKLNICFDCGHEICVDCYKKTHMSNQCCHFCRY